jgi:acyl carrier protein
MAGTEPDDALALVASCIVASFGDEAPLFTRGSSFAELGADSVRVVEIVHLVECRLDCEFSEAQLVAVVSVDDLCQLVETVIIQSVNGTC